MKHGFPFEIKGEPFYIFCNDYSPAKILFIRTWIIREIYKDCKRTNGKNKKRILRDFKVLLLRLKGFKNVEISKRYGITPCAVVCILAKHFQKMRSLSKI